SDHSADRAQAPGNHGYVGAHQRAGLWKEDRRRDAGGGADQRTGDRSVPWAKGGGVEAMLELQGVNTFYGPNHVLHDVTLQVNKGEIVCLLGANAAGKSTTMKTIFGLVKPRNGRIMLENERLDTLGTDQVIKRGLALVPEGRGIFSRMRVHENLEMGAFMIVDRSTVLQDIERVYTLFPRLKERDKQLGGTLSGGEQQMLAMGRALMARPRLICMDE